MFQVQNGTLVKLGIERTRETVAWQAGSAQSLRDHHHLGIRKAANGVKALRLLIPLHAVYEDCHFRANGGGENAKVEWPGSGQMKEGGQAMPAQKYLSTTTPCSSTRMFPPQRMWLGCGRQEQGMRR